MGDVTTSKTEPREPLKVGRRGRAVFVLVLGLVIWFLPPPPGLDAVAMHLLGIFAATIAGLILQPVPQGAVVLTGVCLVAITGTLPLKSALSGYADGTVWLIVTAFLIARGFIKSGLGRRIAYLLVLRFGGSTLGLGYALTAADLFLAPATPSNTARSGGILFPIVRSLCSCLGSEPGPTARKAGAFLIFNQFQCNLVTSALFLTAVAPNALMAKLSEDTFGHQLTWFGWFWSASVPALVSLIILPLVIYYFLRPEVVRTEEARDLAREELVGMGRLSSQELRMLVIFVLTLGLWATGQWTGFGATAVALSGVCALVLSNVLSWEDVLGESKAWDALIWFGGLVSMASGLAQVGVIGVFAETIEIGLSSVNSWIPGFLLLILAYVYSHYFVASMTAHATALYVPMALVAVGLGAPVPLVAVVLGFMNSLNAALTTYGTGPAPIYYEAGFLEQATWWKYGWWISVFHLVVWLGIGGMWWKLIGLW